MEYYGIKKASFDLLTIYLHNGKHCAVHTNATSDFSMINTRALQGSILCPLLFLHQWLTSFCSKVECLLYADDTTLYTNIAHFSSDSFETEINH